MPAKQSNTVTGGNKPRDNWGHQGSTAGSVYGLGIIGAAFYFIPHAVGANEFIMGILKSLVWPAILVYQAFSRLGL